MKIALDIGHANGTGSAGNGLQEHDIAEQITGHLAVTLRAQGHIIDIIDFAQRSNAGDLKETIKRANTGNYDLGISIHCDCSDNPDAKGAHTCYLSTSGKLLAEAISDPLAELLPGRADKIVKRTNLAILKQTRPIWTLIECGFISNKDDADIMRNAPDAIARAIAHGINTYTYNQHK
ncbi:MAG: N-acetylmuramoyl-L-alanine amidase [Akkermansia sp.]